MRLTTEDKQYLKDAFNEDEQSIQQIEDATEFISAFLGEAWTPIECDDQSVAEKVIQIVGRGAFLNGMRRCAFHSSATVESNYDPTIVVYLCVSIDFWR